MQVGAESDWRAFPPVDHRVNLIAAGLTLGQVTLERNILEKQGLGHF